jgi:uncharacterized protein YkwD
MACRLLGLLGLTLVLGYAAGQCLAAEAITDPATAGAAAEDMIRAALVPPPVGVAPDSDADMLQFAQRMVTAVNQVRAQRGLPPVRLEPALMRTAQDLAADLASRHEISHVDSSGAYLGTRLDRHGYVYSRAVENVAGGLQAAEYIVQLWENSPEHARNLFNPVVCQAGVGFVALSPGQAQGVLPTYWVLDMAQPMRGGCR